MVHVEEREATATVTKHRFAPAVGCFGYKLSRETPGDTACSGYKSLETLFGVTVNDWTRI